MWWGLSLSCRVSLDKCDTPWPDVIAFVKGSIPRGRMYEEALGGCCRMMVPSAVLLSFEFRSLNFHPPPLGHSEPWVILGDYTRSISASEQVTELVGEETHPASAWEIWGSGRWSLG